MDELTFYTFLPVGCYCGLVSYNGKVSCSFASDVWLPDPSSLAEIWSEEFEELYAEVMAHEGALPEPKKDATSDLLLALGAAVAVGAVVYALWRR